MDTAVLSTLLIILIRNEQVDILGGIGYLS